MGIGILIVVIRLAISKKIIAQAEPANFYKVL